MRYAVAHLERNGLLSWEGFDLISQAETSLQGLALRLRATEAAYLVRLNPPAWISPEVIGEWLDQSLDLIVVEPQAGITIVTTHEGPQFRRLRSAI